MYDLLVRGGLLVDPVNRVRKVCDVALEEGLVAAVAEEIPSSGAREVIDASGKVVMPGIVDMHTHMRTQLGHPHAQRMIALAGVCTTLDMAGPLDNILDSIPGSGAGVNIATVEGARFPETLASARPGTTERRAFIEKHLEHGGIGVKLLGGHFPMDLDICRGFIEDCSAMGAWVGWHAGNSDHGSNIEGMRDAVAAAEGCFLHLAHINSYCRGYVNNEVDEAVEAAELLRRNPNIFAESYLSPLNGTRLTIKNGVPYSKVTASSLKKVGCEPTEAGMAEAILKGRAGVLCDDGTVGRLVYGEEGLSYWRSRGTVTTGCFAINPAASRFLLAVAKRDSGAFVVDSFSTDGGCYPRNVIVENGLLLVKFGALTLPEFVTKASVNGARALGLPGKGHLSVGADGDITIIDTSACRAAAAVAGGRVIMKDGVLCGSGTTIICDERGEAYLRGRGIRTQVKKPLDPSAAADRFVCPKI